jgi:hypothetical protein
MLRPRGPADLLVVGRGTIAARDLERSSEGLPQGLEGEFAKILKRLDGLGGRLDRVVL